jgi:hypothetical protein
MGDGSRVLQIKIIVDLILNFGRDQNLGIDSIVLDLEFFLVKFWPNWGNWLFGLFTFCHFLFDKRCSLLGQVNFNSLFEGLLPLNKLLFISILAGSFQLDTVITILLRKFNCVASLDNIFASEVNS